MAPLEGVLAKLDRAHEHLETLEAETAAYVKRETYAIVDDFDRDKKRWTFRFKSVEKIPLRLSTIAGDIAHNLRSALDHLLWELVETSGGEPSKANQFPIATRRDTWRHKRLGAPFRLRGLQSPTMAAEIQRLQPYRGWETYGQPVAHPLYRIERFSNWDKHRLLLPAIAAFDFSECGVEWNDDVGGVQHILMGEPGGWLDDGTEIMTAVLEDPIGANPQVKMDRPPPPRIVMATGSDPAVEVFANLETFIRSEVLPRFERFF